MKKISDNYKMSPISRSGKPGFDLFRDEESKQHFFHFNDENGEPFFFSEGYSTSKGQKNGVRSVKANALKKDRFTILGDIGKYYFTLKAANNLEIGRSKYFTTKTSLKKAMKYLKDNVGAGTKQKKVVDSPKKQVKNRTSPIPKKVIAAPSGALEAPKYSFRIDLYPDESKATYRGRIAYLLNDKSSPLNGLEMDKIRNFIQANLPVPKNIEKKKEKVEKGAAATESEAPILMASSSAIMLKEEEAKVWKSKIGLDARQENLTIKILGQKDEAVESIPANEPFYVSVNFENGAKKLKEKTKPFRIELKLKNLEQQLVSPLASYEVDMGKPGKNISPFSVELPEKGMYRLIATVPADSRRMAVGSVLVAAY